MWFGNSFILLMAEVQGIPKDYFEAATIDGAGRWSIFGKITLPLLRPIMMYVAITSLIGGLQLFDVPFLLTDKIGGPNGYLSTAVMYLYNMAFKYNQMGYAAALAYILFAIILVFSGISFLLINATRSGAEIMTGFSLLPGNSLVENWTTVSAKMDLFLGMRNSLIIAVGITILSSYFSSITAYAFAMYDFLGRNTIFTIVLLFMMVPAQLGLFGFYDLVNMLNLRDNYIPLIIPSIASIGTMFFLRQYTASVLPPALLEAPRIDGASELRIFNQIAVPIMMPGIATMSIGTFVGAWNNYLLPLILLNSPKKLTLPLMIGSLKSVQDVIKNQGATYLAVAISVLPILIVFAFLSKYIISSIAAGSVKSNIISILSSCK